MSTPPQLAASLRQSPPSHPLWLGSLDVLSVAAVFIYFLAATWLRWPDPIVDFPRSLYVADQLNQGRLLYDDLACWYGALSPLAESFAFGVFGRGLDTLVWLNIAVGLGCLFLLRSILQEVGGLLARWLGSLIFVVVFFFGNFVIIGNYNFITPYASQATWGFMGLLFVIFALLRHNAAPLPRWLLFAGFGGGIAFLCKPEPVLAAAGAFGLHWACQIARRLKSHLENNGTGASRFVRLRQIGRFLGQELGLTIAGFLAAWTLVFAVLVSKGGPSYAFRAVNWGVHSLLVSSFQKTGINSFFNQSVVGTDDVWKNALAQLVAGALFLIPLSSLLVLLWFLSRRCSQAGILEGAGHRCRPDGNSRHRRPFLSP